MYSNKTNLLWNTRKILEVALNHYSIRHKLLTVCSPQNRATKFAGHNRRLYPEILSRWSTQDLQWFCDTIDNFLLLEERLCSAFGARILSPCTPPFWAQWAMKSKKDIKVHHRSLRPSSSRQLTPSAEELLTCELFWPRNLTKTLPYQDCVIVQLRAPFHSYTIQRCHCYPCALWEVKHGLFEPKTNATPFFFSNKRNLPMLGIIFRCNSNTEPWVSLLLSHILYFVFRESFKTEFRSIYDDLLAYFMILLCNSPLYL